MGDIQLYYEERGSGFPLVFLHGNGESLRYFDKQTEAFSEYYRVIPVDTRGHGQSPRGTAPFTLSQFADDLKVFLDELGIKRAHVLGFSDGGNIALLFALKYSGYVEKLILNGADLSPKGVKASVQIPICIGYGIVSLIALLDKKAVAKKEMLGLMVDQPNIQPLELAMLPMPVLVIAGTKDIIKESHTRLIAKSLPNSALQFIEGGHFVAAKNSGAFNDAVLDFLAE